MIYFNQINFHFLFKQNSQMALNKTFLKFSISKTHYFCTLKEETVLCNAKHVLNELQYLNKICVCTAVATI